MSKKEKPVKASVESLDQLIKKINSEVGNNSIQMCDSKIIADVEVYPTGIAAVDKILGVGGIPRGRIIEIFGPESSGKTTLCLNIMAAVQKAGGTVAFVDAEHALDKEWAQNIGVDLSRMPISQPSSGEESWKIIEMLVTSGLVSCVVVDSVAALTPQVEIDGEITDANIGAQARMMSKGLRKIVSLAHKTKCTVIFINQLRDKVGFVLGNPEVTPGGKALKFYASIRMDIRRKTSIKKGDRSIGNMAVLKIIKNKVAPPFESTELAIKYGIDGTYGIDKFDSILEVATDLGVTERAPSSWYSFDGIKLAAGKEATISHLKANPEILDRISKAISNKLMNETYKRPVAADVGHDEEDDGDIAAIERELAKEDDQ